MATGRKKEKTKGKAPWKTLPLLEKWRPVLRELLERASSEFEQSIADDPRRLEIYSILKSGSSLPSDANGTQVDSASLDQVKQRISEVFEIWFQNVPIKALRDFAKQHEEEEPYFPDIAALELAKVGFSALFRTIEEETDSRVSWDSPLVEYRYPVALSNWDDLEAGLNFWVSGDFTIEALTGGLDRLTDMLLETFASHRAAVSLQMLTRRNYLKKRGDTNAYMVTPAFYESVKDLPPDDQERKRKDHFRPFRIGVVPPRIADHETLLGHLQQEKIDESLLTDEFVEKLEELLLECAEEAADLPAIPFSEVDMLEAIGKRVSGSLAIAIEPLVVDVDKQDVYCPIVVSVVLDRGSASPSIWKKKDRTHFGLALLCILEGAIEILREKETNAALPPIRPGVHYPLYVQDVGDGKQQIIGFHTVTPAEHTSTLIEVIPPYIESVLIRLMHDLSPSIDLDGGNKAESRSMPCDESSSSPDPTDNWHWAGLPERLERLATYLHENGKTETWRIKQDLDFEPSHILNERTFKKGRWKSWIDTFVGRERGYYWLK